MIKNEDDLWRIFRGEDHIQSGRERHPFHIVKQALLDRDAYNQYRPVKPSKAEGQKAKKLIKQTPLTDTTRFYVLIGRERQVCVDQSRLIRVQGHCITSPAGHNQSPERT